MLALLWMGLFPQTMLDLAAPAVRGVDALVQGAAALPQWVAR